MCKKSEVSAQQRLAASRQEILAAIRQPLYSAMAGFAAENFKLLKQKIIKPTQKKLDSD
jgi:hypothetical protein